MDTWSDTWCGIRSGTGSGRVDVKTSVWKGSEGGRLESEAKLIGGWQIVFSRHFAGWYIERRFRCGRGLRHQRPRLGNERMIQSRVHERCVTQHRLRLKERDGSREACIRDGKSSMRACSVQIEWWRRSGWIEERRWMVERWDRVHGGHVVVVVVTGGAGERERHGVIA